MHMMAKKWAALTMTAVLSAASLTACTDNTQVKQAAEQALTKQKEMTAYTFEGSVTLAIGDSLMSSPNLLTNGLLSLLRNSTIEWKGAAALEPLQLENDFTVTPKGSTSPIQIPLLIKDNKMYFNMPALNKTEDEFYEIDLAKMNETGTSPLTPDSLKNASEVASALSVLLFNGIDAKWYKEAKEPVKLTDGSSAKSIAIDITAKNEQEINTLFQSKLPEWIGKLQTNGFLSAEKADSLKSAYASALRLHAPGKLSIAIDEQGFIRDQLMEVSFSYTDADSQVSEHQLAWHQSYDSINQTPSFTKQVPANIKSFDEILKLLPKKAAQP